MPTSVRLQRSASGEVVGVTGGDALDDADAETLWLGDPLEDAEPDGVDVGSADRVGDPLAVAAALPLADWLALWLGVSLSLCDGEALCDDELDGSGDTELDAEPDCDGDQLGRCDGDEEEEELCDGVPPCVGD